MVYAVEEAGESLNLTYKALRMLGVPRREVKRCVRILPSYVYLVLTPVGVELWRRPDRTTVPTLTLAWSQIMDAEHSPIRVGTRGTILKHRLTLFTNDGVSLPLAVPSDRAGHEIIEFVGKRIAYDADGSSSEVEL